MQKFILICIFISSFLYNMENQFNMSGICIPDEILYEIIGKIQITKNSKLKNNNDIEKEAKKQISVIKDLIHISMVCKKLNIITQTIIPKQHSTLDFMLQQLDDKALLYSKI